MTDLEGNIVDVPNPSGRGPGYRYFGAAKELPVVRELFLKPPELRKRRTRYDIYKRIGASYYGCRDDEDGVLERVEGHTEEKMRAEIVAEWRRMEQIRKEARLSMKSGEVVMVAKEERKRSEKGREFLVHVPLPDEKEIEKMGLLRKYASEGLLEEQSEAKQMLNIQC